MISDSNNEQQTEQTEQISENSQPVNTEEAQAYQSTDQNSRQDSETRNFVELRKKYEREQQEKRELQRKHEEALRIIQEGEAASKSKKDESNSWNFGEDEDLAEMKDLKKVAQELERQKKEFEEYKKKSIQYTAEARLRAQFPDLEKVCSQDNLDRLSKEDPDLYTSLQYNPDIYSQYSAAYRAIKRYGIYQEDNYESDRQKAQENANKPRPLTSVSPQQGNSPLTKANAFADGLTDELKRQLWKETQECSKKS